MSEEDKMFEEQNKRFKYLQQKRLEVLNQIKPICDVFNIKYDYDIQDLREVLILDGQKIGCTSNSIDAIVDEVIGYIFITMYCSRRWFPFKSQVKNSITRYWLKSDATKLREEFGL